MRNFIIGRLYWTLAMMLSLLTFLMMGGCSSSQPEITKKLTYPLQTLNAIYGIPTQPSNQWVKDNLPLFHSAAMDGSGSGSGSGSVGSIEDIYMQHKDYKLDDKIARYLVLEEIWQRRTSNNKLGILRTQRISRERSLTNESFGFGGMAYRQTGYVHILEAIHRTETVTDVLKSSLQSFKEMNTTNSNEAVVQSMPELAKSISVGKSTTALNKSNEHIFSNLADGSVSLSQYELQRWERYCSSNDTTKSDRKFVKKQLELGVNPSDIIDGCQ